MKVTVQWNPLRLFQKNEKSREKRSCSREVYWAVESDFYCNIYVIWASFQSLQAFFCGKWFLFQHMLSERHFKAYKLFSLHQLQHFTPKNSFSSQYRSYNLEIYFFNAAESPNPSSTWFFIIYKYFSLAMVTVENTLMYNQTMNSLKVVIHLLDIDFISGDLITWTRFVYFRCYKQHKLIKFKWLELKSWLKLLLKRKCVGTEFSCMKHRISSGDLGTSGGRPSSET